MSERMEELQALFPTGRMCQVCGLGEKYPNGCFCGAQVWQPVDELIAPKPTGGVSNEK